MFDHTHRIICMLMLFTLVSSMSQARHACVVEMPPAHGEHHSAPEDDAPRPGECRMSAPCNVTAVAQLGPDEGGPAAILTTEATPVTAGYHSPVLFRETPPPRA